MFCPQLEAMFGEFMEPLERRNLLELVQYWWDVWGFVAPAHFLFFLPTSCCCVPSSTLDSLPYDAFGHGISLQQQRNKWEQTKPIGKLRTPVTE